MHVTQSPSPQQPATRSISRKRLANKLRRLRESLNCTQGEMAKVLGIKRGYVGQIEAAYDRIDFQRVSRIVKDAYTQFGASFEENTVTQTTPTQLTFPAIATPPAEIDTKVGDSAYSEQAVAARMQEFQREFKLKPRDIAQILGLSSGHEYVLRTGRAGTSLYTRRNAIAAIEREAATLRAGRTAGTTQTATPTTATPTIATVASTRSTDTVVPAILVQDAAALVSALTCDFTTKHRFQKLPDGSYLVVKER